MTKEYIYRVVEIFGYDKVVWMNKIFASTKDEAYRQIEEIASHYRLMSNCTVSDYGLHKWSDAVVEECGTEYWYTCEKVKVITTPKEEKIFGFICYEIRS